jgi:murein DD-endopeptidase MepM/ murein hydrolase activator NlpD
MGFFSSAKCLLCTHYPRKHLELASYLSVALVLTLFFAPEESAHGARASSPIQVGPSALTRALAGASTNSTLRDEVVVQDNEAEPLDALWTSFEVQAGDNLSEIFGRVGLSAQHMYKVLNSSEEAKVLDRLYPGYELSFHIPAPGELAQLRVLKSPLEGYLFTRNEEGYGVDVIQLSADIVPVVKEGVIHDSLFMAGQRADIPASSIMEMADIFGGEIDFILDTRAGDSFSIVYEEKYLKNEFIGHGEILAARFINQGEEFVAVRYTNEAGETGYYNPEGESMQKAFLRTPLDVFRISSNFSLTRKHPILNTIRAHRGTDYAAPRGTPVRATSDGTVTWAARSGSFGKLIVLQHGDSFETKYAHLNDYAQGVKRGARVKQGQVIGYVGTTGGSTGPHLHYEFLVNGVHKDPRTIVDQLPQAIALSAEELPRFKAQTRDMLRRLQNSSADSRMLSMQTESPNTPQIR